MAHTLLMRSLRSRMPCPPVCVRARYARECAIRFVWGRGRRGRTFARPHCPRMLVGCNKTPPLFTWPCGGSAKRRGQSGKSAHRALLGCLRLPVSMMIYVATQMIKATGCTQKA